MSIIKSQTERIGSIFKGNIFIIPKYQRKYSWTDKERKALWEDIEESINDNMNHFLGTLSFEEIKTEGLSTDKTYEIIDGQQRLATIFILLNSLIGKLKDNSIKDELIREFIGISKLKVKLLGNDNEFFLKIIKKFKSIKKNKIIKRSQKNLYQAKLQFDSLIDPLTDKEIEERIIFIRDKIEVLVFNVESQAQAVKMFSIINDRGLPLSILDKTKSALMLYSTLKLKSNLNDEINNLFENIFDSYDEILENKEKLNILGRFEETTLFTHHYYSSRKYFSDIWNNRDGADTIFNNIKIKCDDFKNNTVNLKKFISEYTNDLKKFCEGYSNLIKFIFNIKGYKKPFQYLEFSATLYPLLVRLYMQGKLNDLINVLESIEVRVYKLKGTNPIADIYWLSSDISENNLSIDDLKIRITDFNEKFMNNYNFKNYLDADIYRNNAVKYILMEYNNEEINIDTYKDLQIEHIFSREPNFNVEDYGFSEDYDYEKNRLGNLTLLEQGINKQIQNVAPINKVNGYLSSNVKDTRNIGGEINKAKYSKKNVDKRRENLIHFCLKRFKL